MVCVGMRMYGLHVCVLQTHIICTSVPLLMDIVEMTNVVGGNHEAINHLSELYYGGWVAPNIYFMGYSGVVRFGGIRIAGLSGIYKKRDYLLGHFESPPYSQETMRSAYHVRAIDVNRLMGLRAPLDVFVSHDWPTGITQYGDQAALLRKKRFLAQDIEDGSLGSPPSMGLLKKLKPAYWFSAHLHTKFAAIVPHEDGGVTRFLSLDKCLPGRQFLQVVALPIGKGVERKLQYDDEWLALIKKSCRYIHHERHRSRPPPPPVSVTPEEVQEMTEIRAAAVGDRIPENFALTASAYSPTRDGGGGAGKHGWGGSRKRGKMPSGSISNPQTEFFLDWMGMSPSHSSEKHKSTLLPVIADGGKGTKHNNPEEIQLDDDGVATNILTHTTINPEEIELDDDVTDTEDTPVLPVLQAIIRDSET